MTTQPTQPCPITAAEFTAVALSLGVDPGEWRLDQAHLSLQYQPAPSQPMMVINTVRMALQNAGIQVRQP